MTLQRSTPARRRTALGVIALSLSAALVGCSAPAGGSQDGAKPPYPSHVHALALEPGTTTVLIASHEGIYEVTGNQLTPSGADIDLMGFAVDAGGRYLASGHPGPGTDLPDPVGLISSDDGLNWTQVSLAGESDFHALAATADGIIGFDGSLRQSTDGSAWTDASPQLQVHSLAGSPAGTLAVATTEDGPYTSNDAGRNWDPLPGAPLIMLAAVTDDALIVGVLPDGGIVTSSDEGASWTAAGQASGYPVAVTAAGTADDLQIWVMTDSGLQHSADGGKTFTTLVQAPGAAS
ncbi:F510_1955 family glycosylhydrolase [Arthrobacter koreensis]|uniref:F510_1955 family glycosylhydrolase n=1 Tax=Arthrobacter koreensis TaxID=199136 RepID=UPI003D8F6A69